jgi:hypothetical protein
MHGVKHLIQCHCVLPQYRGRHEPFFHKFTVFSLINDDDSVTPRFSQCNNCQVIHKVIGICKSEIVPGVDESSAILTVSDIRTSIPEKFCKVMDKHSCDQASWEHLKFIMEGQMWGESIIISREVLGDSTQLKLLRINDRDNYALETHLRQEEVLGEYSV